MRQVFIEGTDKQYSIREDGIVISHYRLVGYGNKHSKKKVYKDIIIKRHTVKYTSGICVLKVSLTNPKKTSHMVASLVAKAFKIKNYNMSSKVYSFKDGDYSNCNCSNIKIVNFKDGRIKRDKLPENISKERRKEIKKKHRKKYLEHLKEIDRKRCEFLPKNYIANILKIPTKDLPDNIYLHHKNLIQFKRKIADKHNIHISKIQ